MAKTAPAVKATHVGSSVSAQQIAVTQEERPTAFAVYPGNVMEVDPSARKLTVSILNGYIVEDCIYASDSIASMLGFTQTTMPPVGSQVLVVYAPGQSYVISGVGANVVDNPEAFSVPASGDVSMEVINDPAYGVRRVDDERVISGGYTPGKDVLPGEKEYSNNMGVWLRLLINMAQLSAGELAKVEVGLMNDMVRIVDNYFAHHNVGGDKLIWAVDGKCVEEDHFTGYGFEAEGKLKEHEELVTCSSNVVDTNSIEDPVNATGRWRKSTYIGFLGDMIHTWVSDPAATLSNYAEGAARAGKYRCWVGADGMLMVQAVGGVHIQVTPRVLIPEVHHNWNDPEFKIEEAFKNLDKNFLKLWGTGTNLWRDLNVACWQMRSWARYITLWHSLERWNALSGSKYCKVTDEADCTEAPEPTAKEKDKEEVNPGGDRAYEGSAMLSIDPSGSISLVAVGTSDYPGTSSVIMNRGNIQIAAPGNLDIQCGGTLSFTAKNVSMKATDHIEIASLAGSLWLKARTAWNALCEMGRMWLKSDFKEGSQTPEYPVKDGVPTSYSEGGAYAICIDAAEGKVAVHGKEEVTAVTSGPDAPVLIKTSMPGSSVNIDSAGIINMHSKVGISVSSGAYFGCEAPVVMFNCMSAKVTDNMLITPASVEVNGFVRAEFVTSVNGFMGNNQHVGVPKDMSTIDPSGPIADADETTYNDLVVTVSDTSERVLNTVIEEVWNDYVWKFNDWSIYDGDVDLWTSYKQPPMILEAEDSNAVDGPNSTLCEVMWTKCGLTSSSTTTEQSSMPWPGSNGIVWSFDAAAVPPMHEAAKVTDGDPKFGGISKMKRLPYNFYVQKY